MLYTTGCVLIVLYSIIIYIGFKLIITLIKQKLKFRESYLEKRISKLSYQWDKLIEKDEWVNFFSHYDAEKKYIQARQHLGVFIDPTDLASDLSKIVVLFVACASVLNGMFPKPSDLVYLPKTVQTVKAPETDSEDED